MRKETTTARHPLSFDVTVETSGDKRGSVDRERKAPVPDRHSSITGGNERTDGQELTQKSGPSFFLSKLRRQKKNLAID